MSDIIVMVEDLKKHFPVEKSLLSTFFSKKGKYVHAVDGITFSIRDGETFGLVGRRGVGRRRQAGSS